MICRWCSHETILTEDATSLISALSGGAPPQAQAQAQMMQQAKEAARMCRECGAQAHPLIGGERMNKSGWLVFDNPDGSMFIEVFPTPTLVDGKPVRRVVRWTLAVDPSPLLTHVRGIWYPTIHDTPGGKREDGRPWEPVAEVPGV